jgi:hypothetical protein
MQGNSPSPPKALHPGSVLLLVQPPIKETRDAFMTTPGAMRVMDIVGLGYRNGAYVGPLAIQLRGTKIVGVIGAGHWLEIAPGEMERGGRVKRVMNRSTGQEVYTKVNIFTGGWWKG